MKFPNMVQWIFFLCCLVGMVLLATVRSPPIYGKIDFIMLDSRPWWPGWKPLIVTAKKNSALPVYTDYITSYILVGVMGLRSVLTVRDNPGSCPVLSVEDMETNILPHERLMDKSTIKTMQEGGTYTCIVNLLGYQPSWVSVETRHWRAELARTGDFYDFKRYKDASREMIVANCSIFSYK